MTKITEEIPVNNTIKDLKIKDIVPNSIDNFVVYLDEDQHHTIYLPSNASGIVFKLWNRGRGGIFSKDVLNYSLNKKEIGKYVHINGTELNCIARLISEDEEPTFKTLKLIDGKIKDKSYMILRHINEDDKLTSMKNYSDDKDIIPMEDLIIIATKNNSTDEEIDYHVGSISLFNDETN